MAVATEVELNVGEIGEAFIDAGKTVTLGEATLAGPDELLLLDATQATAPHPDGQPVFAAGIATSLDEMAKKALKGQTPLPWHHADDPAVTPAKDPTETVEGPYTGKVVRIPVGEDDDAHVLA